jgi:hypothetical protein
MAVHNSIEGGSFVDTLGLLNRRARRLVDRRVEAKRLAHEATEQERLGPGITQANDFVENSYLDDRIHDGFRYAGGDGMQFDQRGLSLVAPPGEIVVVDRTEDRLLQELLQRAGKSIDVVIPEARRLRKPDLSIEQGVAFELMRQIELQASPGRDSMSVRMPLRDVSGQEVLLGNVLSKYKAENHHKALAFKALADEVGLPTRLLQGAMNLPPTREWRHHMWNEIETVSSSGEKKDYIVDFRVPPGGMNVKTNTIQTFYQYGEFPHKERVRGDERDLIYRPFGAGEAFTVGPRFGVTTRVGPHR